MFTERTVRDRNVALGPPHGPPLWLFHGVGRWWQDFAPLLPALTMGWHVHAADHRGHGRSSRADRYLVTDYVADAAGLVADANEPAVLVGHSLGALVTLGVAAARPDAVRAVVLLDPPGEDFLARVDSTPYAAMWEAMRRLAGRGPVGEVARELAAVRLPDPRNAGGTVALGSLRDAAALRFMARCLADLDPAVLTPPLERRWLAGFGPLPPGRVRCPALLVVADPAAGGMLDTAADVERILAALADGTRVDLPGVGHLVHGQDAAATLRVVSAFLGSL